MLVRVKNKSGQGKHEIFDLSLFKEHQAMEEGGFLKEVKIGSTPCAILPSKWQFDNIAAVSQLSFLYLELMQHLNWEISM